MLTKILQRYIMLVDTTSTKHNILYRRWWNGMADKDLLKEKWKKSGKKKVYLSEKMGISRPRLNYIFENPSSATVGQADVLADELHIMANEKKIIFLP